MQAARHARKAALARPLVAAALWLVFAAGAAPAPETDEALELRVNEVASELRCLVCQNQSLADSNAALALDLKAQVREQLRAGRTPAEVVAYMTARYGDFVRYRPPLDARTALLWLGPGLLLGGGAAALWRALAAARRRDAPGPDLGAADLAHARALLGTDPGAGGPAGVNERGSA